MMVHILDIDINMQSPFPMAFGEFEPGEGYTSALRLYSSQPLSEEEIKRFGKHYRVVDISPELSDKQHFISCQHSLIISEGAKDILEALEPEQHQYIEVFINYPHKRREYFEDVKYFYLNVCKRIQAVDISRSVLKQGVVGKGAKHEKKRYKLDFDNLNEIYIKRELVQGANIWRGDEFCLEHYLYISDELKEKWEVLGQKLRTIPCHEI